MYRDSNKRESREFMNGRTAVVSRLAGHCLLELRAIDTGRISDNTKTTRPSGQAANARCNGRNETRTNFFFCRYPHPLSQRAPSSPILPDGSAELERTTADGARANLTHFRRRESVPRAYFRVFFPPTAESTSPPSLRRAAIPLELFTSF